MKNTLTISTLFAACILSACGNESPTNPSTNNTGENQVSSSSTNSELEISTDSKPNSSASISSDSKDPQNDTTAQSSSSDEIISNSCSSAQKIPANYNPETGILTDERDGEKYKTTQIGNQIWMAENLRYLPPEYLEGCIYRYLDEREKPDSLDTYGREYSWMEATKMSCDYLEKVITFGSDPFLLPYQGICPDGWHIPDLDEWKILLEEINNDIYGLVSTNWKGAGFAGTEKYGFNVLPPANHTHVEFIMTNNTGSKSQTMTFDDVGEIQMHTSNQVKTRSDFYLRCIMD